MSTTPDVQDLTEQLLSLSKEIKTYSFEYHKARAEFARCFNKITVLIYKAGLQNSRASFENKIPMLIADPVYTDVAIALSSKMNDAQQTYKGLEQVIDAYKAEISAIQSIIKFMNTGEITNAVNMKYARRSY